MRSVAVKDDKGPVDNLYITDDTAKPSPKPKDLLIKVHAFGLNRMDIMQREGKYPLPPQAGPIMGVEFAGVVEEIGSELQTEGEGKGTWTKGEKVFGLAYGGAYAEYIVNPAAMTIKMPDGMSFEQCAGIPEVWFTAIQALYLVGDLDRSKKERVLIHAGASGVGLAAIQLCRDAGCRKIYATAGTPTKVALCEKMGATKGINYKESDFGEIIKKDGEDGEDGAVDLILDFIGANYWDSNIAIAARDCRIVYLAAMSGSTKTIEIMQILFKRLRIQGTTLRSRDPEYQGALRSKFEDLALQHLIDGEFKAHIDKVYDWQDIKQAQGRMERNEGDGGKIICTIIKD